MKLPDFFIPRKDFKGKTQQQKKPLSCSYYWLNTQKNPLMNDYYYWLSDDDIWIIFLYSVLMIMMINFMWTTTKKNNNDNNRSRLQLRKLKIQTFIVYWKQTWIYFFGGKKISLTLTMITFTIGKKERGPSNIIKNHQDDDDWE